MERRPGKTVSAGNAKAQAARSATNSQTGIPPSRSPMVSKKRKDR